MDCANPEFVSSLGLFQAAALQMVPDLPRTYALLAAQTMDNIDSMKVSMLRNGQVMPSMCATNHPM